MSAASEPRTTVSPTLLPPVSDDDGAGEGSNVGVEPGEVVGVASTVVVGDGVVGMTPAVVVGEGSGGGGGGVGAV